MFDNMVWLQIAPSNLTADQRVIVLRSSMFIKEKFSASGVFDKYKARLVAGGDQQDKELYENLSSPTAAASSVLTAVAIAACERRKVATFDIGGAYLNADIKVTGITVRLKLDKILSLILLDLAPHYTSFVSADGCIYVELDKALYGCVESARLWFEDITGKLLNDGFVTNPYDECVSTRSTALESRLQSRCMLTI